VPTHEPSHPRGPVFIHQAGRSLMVRVKRCHRVGKSLRLIDLKSENFLKITRCLLAFELPDSFKKENRGQSLRTPGFLVSIASTITVPSAERDADVESGSLKRRFSSSGEQDANARPLIKSDYLFVSNVRFLAMISIVWVHSEVLWGVATGWVSHVQPVLIQCMKFGTIGFFLISGFLLGEGLTCTHRAKYFYRRLNAVFIPWMCWGFLWFVIALTYHLAGETHPEALRSSLRAVMGQYFRFVFTQSIYWFVPNFFVCLAIVLGLYRRVPDYLQGVVYLAMSLFYGVNVYLEIIPTRHTSALLGFVFYLWLGSFAYKHREVWTRWLARTSWLSLIAYTVVAAGLALVETHILRTKHHSVDSANTLRIANQAFSVLAVLLIVKCKRSLYPASFNVRSETFGIFLIHPILIEIFIIATAGISQSTRAVILRNGPLLMLFAVVTFIMIYLLSVLITKQIRRVSFLRWVVGR
jgi:Acyltransferase family